MLEPDYTLAARHVELLTGSADTACHFRLLRGTGRGWNLSGKLADLWSTIETRQFNDWQVFVVVNEGGHNAAAITRVRAIFVDGDNIPQPTDWHARPDFITRRDAMHWHAFWRVADMPVSAFKVAQQRLAAHYNTDPAVCDLPRIMRLAGTLHLKDPAHPHLVTIEADAHRQERTAVELLTGLPDLAVEERVSTAALPTGEPVSSAIVRDMLGVLDPGCDRKEWLIILTAVRAAPVPGDDDESERRQLAHEWSVQAANYTTAEDVDRVFDTMPPRDPGEPGIHFGTLVAKARAAGYAGPISIAEAERNERWLAAVSECIEEQAEAAFWQRIVEGSQGAIQPMPPPSSAPPSPAFVEQMRQIVAEEKRHGEEVARRWGLR